MRILEGNPGKRPLPKNEPKPAAKKPSCPRHLKGEARREWKRTAGKLFALGLLTEIDRPALAMYCEAWARWVEAEDHLAREGYTFTTDKGYYGQSPWVGISNKAMAEARRFMQEFGMTPSARTRIQVEPQKQADPYEEFINRGKRAISGK